MFILWSDEKATRKQGMLQGMHLATAKCQTQGFKILVHKPMPDHVHFLNTLGTLRNVKCLWRQGLKAMSYICCEVPTGNINIDDTLAAKCQQTLFY